MPHHIRILSVKTQHLQDITEDDCLAEGIGYDEEQSELKYFLTDNITKSRFYFATAKEAFAFFITQTEKNMRDVWAKDPPVFVYTFETID